MTTADEASETTARLGSVATAYQTPVPAVAGGSIGRGWASVAFVALLVPPASGLQHSEDWALERTALRRAASTAGADRPVTWPQIGRRLLHRKASAPSTPPLGRMFEVGPAAAGCVGSLTMRDKSGTRSARAFCTAARSTWSNPDVRWLLDLGEESKRQRRIIREELEPAEADAVREAVRRVLGGESLRSIAFDFNKRGIRPAGGKKNGASKIDKWQGSTLRRVLLSPRIAGLREHNGEVVGKAVWPAIIDEATHDRLVGLLKDPHRPPLNYGRSRLHPLAGLV